MTNVEAVLLLVWIWNYAATVVPDQLPDLCHPHPTISIRGSKVSNGHVCDICQKFGLAGSKTEKYKKPKTITESCIL